MVWSNVELLLGETKMNLLSNKYVTIKMHVCVQWVKSNYVKYDFFLLYLVYSVIFDYNLTTLSV